MLAWLSGLRILGWLSGVKSGASRWINAETGKALMVAVLMVALVAGGTLLFAGGKSAGGAKIEASWLRAVNKLNATRAKLRADRAERVASAAQSERERAEAERDEALNNVALLERQIADLQDKSLIAFPASLAKELNR